MELSAENTKAGNPEESGFILHGAVVYSEDRFTLKAFDDAYVVCLNGKSMGVFESVPEEYAGLPVEDFWDKLIIPGLVDLHVHASQFQYRGLGMDMELLEWLDTMAFPEEARFKKKSYAERAYDLFAEDLYIGPTTRAAVFATKHVGATILLMDMLEETGLVTCVGKVNMDRGVPDYYTETTEKSLEDTKTWLARVGKRKYSNTYPILTPRFTPSCTRELMDGLGELAKEHGLPVQSHLSENPRECELVKELEPDSLYYGDTYERSGLFGTNGRCIMAHCVWSGDEEVEKMRENGVFVAHCPDSNMNISSGVAPIRRYLDLGLKVGLGSDVAGGSGTSIFRAMGEAVAASKMRWRLSDSTLPALTFPEVFFMATKGGGEFFGKVGSFEPGFEFDAVIVDDTQIASLMEPGAGARAERLAYLADDRHVVGKYVRGAKLY